VNLWLPRAHTVAPAAFAPFLSGLTLNLGLYGILRVNADLLPARLVGAGVFALLVGALTAFLGILYATIEDDVKRLLAHSSIENVGIVTAAFGAGMIFLATGHGVSAAIAFVAALYHLVNHSVYKALLFMGAGAVDDAAGTRSLNRLGGLLRLMPYTGLFMLVGALAIAAMPPFSGFVSEWLTLQSLLRSVELGSLGVKLAFVGAGAALALTAGLAVTCFVRLFAMGMLGMARSQQAREAREVGSPALAPMAVLALACLALGVLPTYVIPALDRVVTPLAGASGAQALVPPFFAAGPGEAALPPQFASEFHDLGAQVGGQALPGRGLVVLHRGGSANPVVFAMSTSYMLVALLALLGLAAGAGWLFAARRRRVARRPAWAGGVREFLPEMAYTATGFAQPVRVIFEAVLRPTTVEDSRKAIAEHFRVTIRRLREEVHVLDRLVLRPVAAAAFYVAEKLAGMHHGRLNAYATYALLALVLFLCIVSLG
jgi:hydrogenase-4 component B